MKRRKKAKTEKSSLLHPGLSPNSKRNCGLRLMDASQRSGPCRTIMKDGIEVSHLAQVFAISRKIRREAVEPTITEFKQSASTSSVPPASSSLDDLPPW